MPWTPLRTLCALLLFAAGIALSRGQQPEDLTESGLSEDLVFRSWRTEAGLPHNTVNAIVQTRDGYLWIGTREGLARFDGVRFTVFGLNEGLPSVEVQTLYEDRQGTLWIGTSGGGLSRWRLGQIETIRFPQYLAASGTVSSLAEDGAGRLWIGTRAGLTILEHGRFAVEGELEKLSHSGVRALLPDREGGMWIATLSDGRMNSVIIGCGQVLDRKATSEFLPIAWCRTPVAIFRASVGNGTVLCRRHGEWNRYTETNGLPFAYVTCLAEDNSNIIWAGSLDDGLYYFEAGRFLPIRKQQGLSANDVRALCPDREGHIWVGTRTGGLNRLSRRKLVTAGVRQGLTNDYTRSVAETSDGVLLGRHNWRWTLSWRAAAI